MIQEIRRGFIASNSYSVLIVEKQN